MGDWQVARRVGNAACAVLCVLALGLPAGVASGALDVAAVVERVQEWLDGTRDMEARFEQTLRSGALGTGLRESGKLVLQRPGKMRWDYLEPERKVALIVGDSTRLYLEEDRQLWEGRLESGSLLQMLLADDQPIDRLFDAELLGGPDSGGEGAYRLRLLPRADPESLREIVLMLRPPVFAIDSVEVLDAAGNRMLYRFSEVRRNRGLADSIFHFEPPEGTEVIRP